MATEVKWYPYINKSEQRKLNYSWLVGGWLGCTHISPEFIYRESLSRSPGCTNTKSIRFHVHTEWQPHHQHHSFPQPVLAFFFFLFLPWRLPDKVGVGELQVVVQPRFHPRTFLGTAALHGAKATRVSHRELRLPSTSIHGRLDNVLRRRERERERLKERAARAGRSVGARGL